MPSLAAGFTRQRGIFLFRMPSYVEGALVKDEKPDRAMPAALRALRADITTSAVHLKVYEGLLRGA